MKRSISGSIAAAVAVTLAGTALSSRDAHGAVITLRDGITNDYATNYAGVQDTYLYGQSSHGSYNMNFGGETFLQVQNTSSTRLRTLIGFDLANLAKPVGNVVSAKLVLTKSTTAATGTPSVMTVTAFQFAPQNGGWVEGRGTASTNNALVGESTGALKRVGDADGDPAPVSWTYGLSANAAYVSYPNSFATSSTYSTADPAGKTIEVTLDPALVQQWITSPASNSGLGLSASGGSALTRFASSEYTANPEWRPTLVIVDDTPVPEPTTVALLCLAPLALLRRRRGD